MFVDIYEYVVCNGIKIILNLCGDNKGSFWYEDEVVVVKDFGINYVDFGMSVCKDFDFDRIR